MSKQPLYSDAEFVGATQLNNSATVVYAGQQEDLIATHSPGLINPSTVTVTASGMVFTFTCGSTFAGVFGNGFLGRAFGTTAGSTTNVYTVDLTSYVPGSGSQVVYISIAGTGVDQSPYTVMGPPAGHPDFDATFVPYTAYASVYNTLAFGATTTAPDNSTTLEFGRITLSAGQSSVLVSQLVLSHQVLASSVLNNTGVTAGSYNGGAITVGADGRVTAISNELGRLINVQTFSANSTYTPTAGTTTAEILIVAGGGGGGGAPGIGTGSSGPYGVGCGGGGAGGAVLWRGPVSGLSGAAITVGAAGSGGPAGSIGGTGGSSSFVLSGVINLLANGGNGGSTAPALNQTIGCPGGGGGGAGASLLNGGAIVYTAAGSPGAPGLWFAVTGGSLMSGVGGPSVLGGGAPGVSNSTGQAAASYGAGGGGASSFTLGSVTSPGYAGGAGGHGFVIIREYS
jgi:hypothetical protein